MRDSFWDRSKQRLSVGTLLLMGVILAVSVRANAQIPKYEIKPVQPPTPTEFRASLVQATSLIRAGEARSRYNVDGSGVGIAILDTGCRTTHNDFTGRIVAVRNFTPDDGGDPNNVTDGHGHGTHVAGIAAANGPHTGVATGADLIICKVLRNNGSGSFEYIDAALQYCIDNQARYNICVLNLSLGTSQNLTTSAPDSISEKIGTLRAAGVAVCIAAGNSYSAYDPNEGMAYPGVIGSSVSVGAVFDADVGPIGLAFSTGPWRITYFSQRLHESTSAANRTDVFAPGSRITSSGIAHDNASATLQGTSMACPMTAGVCALIAQYCRDNGGQKPDIDKVEDWLRAEHTLNDGDDEDDAVQNTGKNFRGVDCVTTLQRASEDKGLGGGWAVAYRDLLATPFDLLVLRQFRDDFLKQSEDGKKYVETLYANSASSLRVLLENPELMVQAKALLSANRDAVRKAMKHETAVIENTSEVVAFFDAYAAKSPPAMKSLALMVKADMLEQQRLGQTFLGFELR